MTQPARQVAVAEEAGGLMRQPTMLDLFAGQGGASAAMRARDWTVVRVDLDQRFELDLVANIERLTWRRSVDFLWASPPCTEFSRESMPWCRTGRPPSLDLVRAALRIIEESRPRFWAIENVRGAVKWLRPLLGEPVMSTGPVYLWGNLPSLLLPRLLPWKTKTSGKRPDLRSQLPYELSHAFAVGIERELGWGAS
jgi:hypothetical protein